MRVNSPPTTPKRNYKPLPQKPPPPPTRFIEDTRSDNRIKEVHKVSREYEKKLRNKLWRKFWSFFIEV